MKKCSIAELKRRVRIALDQNMVNEQLAVLGDVDTLSLDDIIAEELPVAARIVENSAPAHLLDGGKDFSGSCGWHGAVGYGSGFIALPKDFMRLVSFRMSDWSFAVSKAIKEDDPLYEVQHSRYPGVRGNPQSPVVAIVTQPVGQVLEFFSCTAGENVYVKRARYLPFPKVVGGNMELCKKLIDPIVYQAAANVALSIGNADAATGLGAKVKTLLEQ